MTNGAVRRRGGSQIGMFGLNPSCSPTASTVHLPIRCCRPTFLPHRRSPRSTFRSHAPKAKPARQIEEASLAQGATTRDQESKQSLNVTNSTKSRFFLPSQHTSGKREKHASSFVSVRSGSRISSGIMALLSLQCQYTDRR